MWHMCPGLPTQLMSSVNQEEEEQATDGRMDYILSAFHVVHVM